MKGKFETSISIDLGAAMLVSLLIFGAYQFVPGLSFVGLLLPVSFGYILIRKGAGMYLASLLWFAFAAYLIGGLESVLFPAAAILGYMPAYHYVFYRRNALRKMTPERIVKLTIEEELSSPWRNIFIFTVGGIVTLSILALGVEMASGKTVLAAYTSEMDVIISQVREVYATSAPQVSGANVEIMVGYLESLKQLLPSLFFTAALGMGFIIYPLSRMAYRRLGLSVPKPARIAELRFPKNIAMGMAIILIMFFGASQGGIILEESALPNLMFITFASFSVLGVSSIVRSLGSLRYGKLLSALLSMALIAFSGSVGLGIIGMLTAIRDGFTAEAGTK